MVELSSVQVEQLEIIRRVCDRGIHFAFSNNNLEYVDLFQHILDELERFKAL